ncbi:MAG TPA: hypothetical protein VGX92_03795 [Pyrinomonadaceae bacterium]|jgi:hypothetical protein|nr:hypothetical protein [Pyrinomonadaceae bacterium]
MTPRYRKYLFRAVILALACVLASAIVAPSAAAAQGGRIDRRIIARAQAVSGDRFQVFTRTPGGVNVFAVTAPSAGMLRAIDDGFTALFAVSRRHGYRARLDYSAYTVFIARADRVRDSRGAYSPDVAVGAGQYAGSAYDQGGFIYAAGMVLEFNHGVFLIAEHQRDLRRVSDVVRYEGEHLVLYHNDPALYQRTADHSRGGGHPILQ